MPQLAPGEWLLLALGALGIGVSKSGLAGFGVVHVLAFALVGRYGLLGLGLSFAIAYIVSAADFSCNKWHSQCGHDYVVNQNAFWINKRYKEVND